MNATVSRQSFVKPAAIAFGLGILGFLPVAAMAFGLYQVGMCDPAPLLALVWLAILSLGGTGFSMCSLYRVEKEGSRITVPILAAVLNISGLVVSLWFFTR